MVWRINDPQANESAKIKYDIVQYTRGRGIDVGCGPFKAFPHFIGLDSGHHWGTKGADIVSEADNLDLFGDDSMDFVFSSHLLEHMEDPKKALAEWWRVIKPGGHLVLYLPHDELYPKVGERGANPDHKFNLNENVVIEWMAAVGGWDLLVSEIRNTDRGAGNHGNEYSFFQVFRKRSDGVQFYATQSPKPKKTVCVCRFGGYGDMLQISSVLPGLKKQGYHVTIMTTPKGQSILKDDPHVDAWFIQDNDQVPNEELGPFWDAAAKRFDKFINFSESIEGALLAIPGRPIHDYSHEARHVLCNVNYFERTHLIAGVPNAFRTKFYPSEDEKAWVKEQMAQLEGRHVLLWSLSGSALHKASPYTDNVMARLLLTYPEIHVVMVGDEACQLLEGESWANEPRVWARSGKWTIRQTLAFAQACHTVVGPETGVLNAVSLEPMAKVVFLSHSSKENLTKHWRNTRSVIPKNTKCHPCHKMHYGKGTCPWTEIDLGADGKVSMPACTADIGVDQIYNAICDCLRKAA